MKTQIIVVLLSVSLYSCTPVSKPLPENTPTDTPQPTVTITLEPTVTLTPEPTATSTPESTPFGGFSNNLIAYQDIRWGDIFVSSVTGDNKINLTQDLSDSKQFVSWTPDGERILFITFKTERKYRPEYNAWVDWFSNDSPGEFWAVKTDGTEKQLLWTDSSWWQSVSWSADGMRFITNCPDNEDEICFVSLPDFTVQHTGYIGGNPIFSNNADDFAWIGGRGNVLILFIVDKENQTPTEIPFSGSSSLDFVWMPDEQSILVFQYVKQSATHLYQVNIDGTKIELKHFERVISPLWVNSINKEPPVALTPNGWRILVRSHTISQEGRSVVGVPGVMDLSGENLLWFDSFAYNNNATVRWTPDQKQIIAQKWNDGTLCIVNPFTGNVTSTDWMNWLAGITWKRLPDANWFFEPSAK